jgi:hypothetical protein
MTSAAQQVHPAQLQGGDECEGITGHLLDGVRGAAGRPADPGVVEGDDPPGGGQLRISLRHG